MGFAYKISQSLVGPDSTASGDAIFKISGKTADVKIECPIGAGFNVVIGWNENANKDILIPGQSKSYGIDGGYLDGNDLYVNFVGGGAGLQQALVTIWKETEEVC